MRDRPVEPLGEANLAEGPGMGSYPARIPSRSGESSHGVEEAFRRRLVVEQTCAAVDHRFNGAPAAERQHWLAGRHRLDRRDAEILLARQDEGAAARHQPFDFVIRKVADDPDRRPGASAQTRLPGPGSDHDEWQPCSIARINDVIDPLVGGRNARYRRADKQRRNSGRTPA